MFDSPRKFFALFGKLNFVEVILVRGGKFFGIRNFSVDDYVVNLLKHGGNSVAVVSRRAVAQFGVARICD